MLDVTRGVQGRLDAQFDGGSGNTAAHVIDAAAPLELRGPFADGDVSRFYLRNVSCGVFAGDVYRTRLHAQRGARAFVSASSATKVHAMPFGSADSGVRITTSPDAVLAYYDGPTILQQGSDLSQRVEIVADGGTAIWAEVLVFGRLARGEALDFRRYRSELVVRDPEGCATFIERFDLRPDRDESIADASMPVLGKVIVAGANVEPSFGALELSREGLIAGCDHLPGGAGAVVRAAGQRLEPVARLIEEAVSAAIRARGSEIKNRS